MDWNGKHGNSQCLSSSHLHIFCQCLASGIKWLEAAFITGKSAKHWKDWTVSQKWDVWLSGCWTFITFDDLNFSSSYFVWTIAIGEGFCKKSKHGIVELDMMRSNEVICWNLFLGKSTINFRYIWKNYLLDKSFGIVSILLVNLKKP